MHASWTIIGRSPRHSTSLNLLHEGDTFLIDPRSICSVPEASSMRFPAHALSSSDTYQLAMCSKNMLELFYGLNALCPSLRDLQALASTSFDDECRRLSSKSRREIHPVSGFWIRALTWQVFTQKKIQKRGRLPCQSLELEESQPLSQALECDESSAKQAKQAKQNSIHVSGCAATRKGVGLLALVSGFSRASEAAAAAGAVSLLHR